MEELKERLKNEKEVSENSSSSREKSSEESLRQTTATVSNTKDNNNNTSQDINNNNNNIQGGYDDNVNNNEIHKDDDNEDIDVPEFQTIEHNDDNDNDICHVNMNYKRRKSNISNLYSENIPITTKTSMLKDKIKRRSLCLFDSN